MIRKEKIKGIDYLLNRFQEKHLEFNSIPKCSFLLGAGCSISSGIPSGFDIIQKLRKLWFISNFKNGTEYKLNGFEIDEEKFENLENEFQSAVLEHETQLIYKVENSINKLKTERPNYLKKLLGTIKEDDLKNNLINDQLYGFWFESFSENPKERQKLIESLIENKEPSGAYLLLAHLIANEKIKNIFTTNFDDLLYDSLIRYTDTKPKIYSHNEVAQYINTLGKRPNIIKLHGDFLFENIKNTELETSRLWENMESKLEESLKNFDLIIIGYNGSDSSVMDSLAKLKSNHYGLIWCGRSQKKLNWRVIEFINNTPNSFFVEIDTFELLMFQLYKVYEEEISFPDFIKIAEKKNKEFNNYISEFAEELTTDESIDLKIRDNIQNTLSVILDRDSFFEIASMPNKEQVLFLQKLKIDGIGRTLKNIYSHINWEHAIWLYESLDKDNFFQNKIQEAPIQHISNSLSNLKKIEPERTKNILDLVENNILLQKINKAKSEDLYSAINELKAISPKKIELIVNQRNINTKSIDLQKLDLRRILYKINTLSYKNALVLFISNNEIIRSKLKKESIKEVVLFFDTLSKNHFKECKNLFESLDDKELSNKISSQNLNLLSITLRVFNSLNREKTKKILNYLDNRLIEKKLEKSSLTEIKSILFTLKDVDFKLSKKLLSLISDDLLLRKFTSSDISILAESAEYISKIDFDKIKRIIKRIDNTLITKSIDKNDFTFQKYGNAISKLIVFDFDKFCQAARNSNIEILSDKISRSLNKTGEQVFLHFVPTYFKVDRNLFSLIIKKSNQDYINSILKWPKIDLYTVNLPYLKRAFESNKMEKESKYIDYIIKNNQNRFKKKKDRNRKKY
ncbi:SIR2 family protein [uncultured Polaribacter sp.]|uniref:SIR2 family protein n=1 Tax=uncultured Polaribacter sp. TaxID=174711 RepID=UPI00261E47AC|nr:SIR2 family protein [uncultured Polaribacter sp.]